jgi:Putative Flp pilus-assembly TadE/G-like
VPPGSARERGSAALFVAIFAPAMIFLAGLVIDGGAALEVRQRAADIAEQAARAAGQECDVGLLRSVSECRITSQPAAEAAAGPYLDNNGVTSWHLDLFDPADGTTDQFYGVRVTVTIEFRTTLLGIVPAYQTMTITQTGEAVAVTGL